MKMKNFIVSMVSIALIFCFSFPAFASEKNKQELPPNADIIVNEIVSAYSGKYSLSSVSDAKIVEMDQGYAVQLESVTANNETAVTTIVPYKVDTNENLVNSFEYLSKINAQNQDVIKPMDTSEVPTTFVDVTLTVRTYYAHYFSWTNVANFYRHAGIEAWWSSNNSTVSVSNMRVWYDTAGELYKYPDCIDKPLSETKVQDYYFIRSSIEQSNPTKGNVYIDGNHTMPLDRVVLLTDYFNHGGLIYLKLDYSVNGKSRSDERSYYVYSK